jgi:hypothetical protein
MFRGRVRGHVAFGSVSETPKRQWNLIGICINSSHSTVFTMILPALFSYMLASPVPADTTMSLKYSLLQSEVNCTWTGTASSELIEPIFVNQVLGAWKTTVSKDVFVGKLPIKSTAAAQRSDGHVYFGAEIDMKYMRDHLAGEASESNQEYIKARFNSAAQQVLAVYGKGITKNIPTAAWEAHITFVNIAPFKLELVPESGSYSVNSKPLQAAFAAYPDCS